MLDKLLNNVPKIERELFTGFLKVGLPAALGVACASIRYLFDVGYCRYFKIPTRLIKIELVDVIFATIAFCGIFFLSIYIMREYFVNFLADNHPVTRKVLTAGWPIIPMAAFLLLKSTNPILIFGLLVLCLMYGTFAKQLAKKERDSPLVIDILVSVLSTAFFVYVIFPVVPLGLPSWVRFFVAMLPALFGVLIFLIYKSISLTNPDQTPSSDTPVSEKLPSDHAEYGVAYLLAICGGAVLILGFMASCTMASGEYTAKTRVQFPVVDLDHKFAILKSYGDLNYLQKISEHNDSYVLEPEYRLLTNSELSEHSRRLAKLGPLSFRDR